jgi:hypothetical protein
MITAAAHWTHVLSKLHSKRLHAKRQEGHHKQRTWQDQHVLQRHSMYPGLPACKMIITCICIWCAYQHLRHSPRGKETYRFTDCANLNRSDCEITHMTCESNSPNMVPSLTNADHSTRVPMRPCTRAHMRAHATLHNARSHG